MLIAPSAVPSPSIMERYLRSGEPVPCSKPDTNVKMDISGTGQEQLRLLQRQFPVLAERREGLDYTPSTAKSVLIEREGLLQEISPVFGSETQIRHFFAPDGDAEQIVRRRSEVDKRIFAVSDRFYAMPEHEIARAEKLAAASGFEICVLLPDIRMCAISCRNEGLEGEEHPGTGVPFERKVILINGEEVEGVFAQFDSQLDVMLPEQLYMAGNKEQFEYANEQLRQAVESDPQLRAKFTDEQLEQIRNGDRPDGYVWHHSENPGQLQLVDKDTHDRTGHTGGQVVWGGGADNR